jgi:hypothetical protein
LDDAGLAHERFEFDEADGLENPLDKVDSSRDAHGRDKGAIASNYGRID